MLQSQPPSSGLSPLQQVLWLIVLLLASNTVNTLLTTWLNRKRLRPEIDETEARTDLARAQSQKTVAETLKTVSDELRETQGALHDATERYGKRTIYIELLEKQVATARARGFLDREERDGMGPNPAA